jgi:phosphomannomutase
MTKIKFGTDGWRAIIAKDFTVENVTRITEATAKWLLKDKSQASVVVGHDCRFAGELFAETVAKVMTHYGITVHLAKGFVSTPMVSLGTQKLKADLGIIITASHNPPSYNGYKLKGPYGGPLLPEKTDEVEKLLEDKATVDSDSIIMKDLIDKGIVRYVDLETMYCDHVEENFDLDAIRNSGLSLAYDAMYGAGQNVIRRLLPETTMLHCEHNPSFEGQAPEPIDRNLREFAEMIELAGDIDCGLATDGDADRIGLYDSKGNFVDSHHIILLLIKYLVEQKGYTGKVVTAFSVTPKVKLMCERYGLPHQVVKIGFKHIAGIMITEDVLLGGEESGGIAVKGHIPERDGLWMGFIIWEYMARSGKSLEDLIAEVYEITGKFSFERSDLHLNEEVKNKIVARCKEGQYKTFGKYAIQHVDDLDGYKYFFNDKEWVMIRASGTEPVLRVYAESSTREDAFAVLDATKETLLNS